MECCFVNLVRPGDTVIVCQNGVFGGRMKENVERCGGTVVLVEDEWGSPVDLQKVSDAFANHPGAALLAFVHAETSTGVQSDAATLCQLAERHGAMSIVDTVTSLGGIGVAIDDWGADAVYSGTQKCLSCVPGISPESFSPRATEFIKQRQQKVQSWFLDMNLVMGYWGGDSKRAYHHTAPVNALYALHESLLILKEEGLQQAWQHHDLHHRALVSGLEAMGLSMLVSPEARLPQLNLVSIPEGVDDGKVRAQLLHDYHLEIGAGLGALAGKAWRIGLMGHACNRQNVLLCVGALANVLAAQGFAVDVAGAVAASNAVYAD